LLYAGLLFLVCWFNFFTEYFLQLSAFHSAFTIRSRFFPRRSTSTSGRYECPPNAGVWEFGHFSFFRCSQGRVVLQIKQKGLVATSDSISKSASLIPSFGYDKQWSSIGYLQFFTNKPFWTNTNNTNTNSVSVYLCVFVFAVYRLLSKNNNNDNGINIKWEIIRGNQISSLPFFSLSLALCISRQINRPALCWQKKQQRYFRWPQLRISPIRTVPLFVGLPDTLSVS